LARPCKIIEEGHDKLEQIRQMLEKAGLKLKGKDGPPVDLREGKAQLLGLALTVKEGKVCFDLGENAWKKLREGLTQAHTTRDPAHTARQVVVNWLGAYGPAYPTLKGTDTLDHVIMTAAELGFREDIVLQELRKAWRSAWHRWKAIRAK